MAEGLSTATANSLLNAIGNATAYSEAEVWVQLHTAAPGSAGTGNIAGNATRKQISFGAAASGSMASDTELSWSDAEVDTSEDYTHATIWDDETAGNFVLSGLVTANAVDASGDTLTIAVGGITVSFTVAS